ncbi:hypothetical protein C8Q79DRAFT_1011437 [Trametes meyenii]|nr:hypothetical protein C8Q79DRAFT_1011437 [Trametes meyenii]
MPFAVIPPTRPDARSTPQRPGDNTASQRRRSRAAPNATFTNAKLTLFAPGQSGCNTVIHDDDFAVALSSHQWNGGAYCDAPIHVQYQGTTVAARVMDECLLCREGDLDLTPGLFTRLTGNISLGQVVGSWSFDDGPSALTSTTFPGATSTDAGSRPATATTSDTNTMSSVPSTGPPGSGTSTLSTNVNGASSTSTSPSIPPPDASSSHARLGSPASSSVGGIVAGCVILTLIALLLGFVCIRRRRRNARRVVTPTPISNDEPVLEIGLLVRKRQPLMRHSTIPSPTATTTANASPVVSESEPPMAHRHPPDTRLLSPSRAAKLMYALRPQAASTPSPAPTAPGPPTVSTPGASISGDSTLPPAYAECHPGTRCIEQGAEPYVRPPLEA